MATSLIPDPANPQVSLEPSTGNPTPQPESSSPPIPPTNQPAVTPTETPEQRYTRLLEESLRETNQRLQQQQDEITRIRQAPVTPQAPAPTPDAATFFNDPAALFNQMENRIKQHLDATVAPLQQFVSSMKGEGTPYGNVKAQVAADPQLGRHLNNPKISIAVDKILEGQQNITRDIMVGAVIQAAGMEATGQLDAALVRSGINPNQFSPSPEPQPQPPVRVTPPHVSPTPPQAPTYTPPTTEPKEYTENEKRIMRERGWKPGDGNWEKWMGLSPNEVTTKKFGGA